MHFCTTYVIFFVRVGVGFDSLASLACSCTHLLRRFVIMSGGHCTLPTGGPAIRPFALKTKTKTDEAQKAETVLSAVILPLHPFYKNVGITEIYIIYMYNCQKENLSKVDTYHQLYHCGHYLQFFTYMSFLMLTKKIQAQKRHNYIYDICF